MNWRVSRALRTFSSADFSMVQTFAFDVPMMSAICCWVNPCLRWRRISFWRSVRSPFFMYRGSR